VGAPREEIATYAESLGALDFTLLNHEGDNQDANKFCDGDACLV